MKTAFVFIILIFSSLQLFAGDPPSVPVTGIPQVDLFSIRDMRIPLKLQDSIPDFNQMTSTPSKKSPWLAAGMSLLVPGSGEVYAGNYLKGAIFFGIEVGAWLTAYLYDKKGDDQTVLFESYANEHWNAVRYAKWTYEHTALLNDDVTREEYNLMVDAEIDTADPNNYHPPFEELDWEQLHAFERDIADGATNGYTHVLPFYAQQQYYELIGKYVQFYAGWDDAIGDKAMEVKPSEFVPSEESRYRIYAKMRAEANSHYDVASAMVSVAVINHVLSALDAAWTAAQFNNDLQASVNLRLQPTPFGMVPVKEARVRFTF